MPELPEVEHLRRTLEPRVVGARVVGVNLLRRDVVRDCIGRRRGKINARDLLAGTRIARLTRHGKNLAIVGENRRVVCVHLGMSGQMFLASDTPNARLTPKANARHVHCTWRLHRDDAVSACGRSMLLHFRDPRRFGGLWLFDSHDSLCDQRLRLLGPDALSISPAQLRHALSRTDRAIKAALLAQSVLAGVGNIYADEALFLAKIHPLSKSSSIPSRQLAMLARTIRTVLHQAIAAGGSSIRDYIDGNGDAGEFAIEHRVYGRGHEPCLRCGKRLRQSLIAQRTTVYCTDCQRNYG